MAYRDDDEALAAEATELQRELASVLVKSALPSSTAQPTTSDEEPAEPRRDRLRWEVASLRGQLREAESALAAQRGASHRPPPKGRRDLRLNDPFDLSTAQPAPLPTPPASGWAPLSCATVIIVAVLVCAYLFLSTVPSCFIG